MKRALPNFITLLRILSTPFIIGCFLQGYKTIAFIIFTLSALSDGLDGFLARSLSAKSLLGAYLDPIADKIMVNSLCVMLGIQGLLPVNLVLLIFLRDLFIALGGPILIKKGIISTVKPILAGKISTVFQLCLIGLVIGSDIFSYFTYYAVLLNVFIWLVVGMTLLSGILYAKEGFKTK